ncbi:MAG: aminoacyl-tRNA hydrolase [Bacteroidales bacterium]|nr:aminoacyl-tRNA hydrolase [Bacteroidales bacterium]
MKYLITGLGNIGKAYANTRHNIGFCMLDCLAAEEKIAYSDDCRYGGVGRFRFKGRTLVLLKPSTYMNASGEAIRYWLQKEKTAPDHLLVLMDDIALPFGALRLKPKGSDGGHNGLKSINETLGTTDYARLRFGVGSPPRQGGMIDYVLGEWTPEELQLLPERVQTASKIIRDFVALGVERTMNLYNNK